jgi:Zn-dependent peptidase ImmA (M78 family)
LGRRNLLVAAAIPELQDLIDSDDALEPDQAPAALRGACGLDVAPIENLLQLPEPCGVQVCSAGGPLQAINAFSSSHGAPPVMFLNVYKSAERLHFDLYHELGHLVTHGMKRAKCQRHECPTYRCLAA